MFFYITDTLTDFLPLLLLLFFFNFVFDGKKRRPRAPGPQEQREPERYEPEEYEVQQKQSQGKDLAAEFERLLNKHKGEQVYSEPEPEQQVGCPSKHEAPTIAAPIGVTARTRKKAAHPRLVQGLIMAEVLGKPRSLRPYGDERQ